MIVALAIMKMWGSGTGFDVVNLSAGLRKAGHQPLVITSGGELLEDLRDAGIPMVFCPLDARSPWTLWANGRRLAKILRDRDVDVFNPQGVFPAVSGYWATRRLLKRGRKIPNIVTVAMLSKLKPWYYRLGSWVLNRVADHVIVESECEQFRLCDAGMKRSTTVLYNCVPPDPFVQVCQSRAEIRRELGWPEDRVVFLMPARMSPEKRHDLLLAALARPETKDLPILCYLAGDGPTLDAMKQMAARLGVANRVVFAGFRRDMPRLYKAADVYLLCSRYESLPLSIREAMRASLPVLSTNVGGIAEAVVGGRSGLLVPPNDSAALAAAIARLASDAALRAALGRHGREINQRKFDYAQWVSRTIEVMSAVRDTFVRNH
jgi:glycosyltransferase involved in cell wall biosynthesis